MAYMQSLVSLGLFDTVEVGFLPKGHTHEDIDQCFSQSSCRLKQNNAITLTDSIGNYHMQKRVMQKCAT